jgi:hypothetical protein
LGQKRLRIDLGQVDRSGIEFNCVLVGFEW